MTDEELGLLLVKQRKLKKQVSDLEEELRKTGLLLESLGEALRQRAGKIIFSNAPERLGNIPMELLSGRDTFEWRATTDLLNLEHIAQQIQDLRTAGKQLADLDAKLR